MRTADGYIINKCLNGEPEAFGVLVDRYRASMFALAYSKLNSFEDAEDVTQEAFIQAYKNLRMLKQYDSFHAWLYSITSNLCKKLKIQQSKFPDSEFIEDQTPGMMRKVAMNSYRDDSMLESIRDALDSLPQVYREVLTLHYLGGMSSDEMAETIGTSPSAIRQRLSRARMQLKEEVIAMMSETFQRRRLSVKFTFNIIEMVKKIKIHPVSHTLPLPYSISLAIGMVLTFLSLSSYVPQVELFGSHGGSPLPVESKVLKVGEIPVDVLKASNIATISNQSGNGDGGELKPNMENAFFMAPQAEGKWTKRADMPTARWGLSTSVVKDKIYAIGGWNDNFISVTERYDPVSDEWTKKANMPTSRFCLSTSVVDGKIYAIGGALDVNAVLPTVEEYDPSLDRWKKKADMPTARGWLSTSVVNGKIYAIGGAVSCQPAKALSIIEEYDPATDKWTRKADMPTVRTELSTSVVNGKIYAIGGCRAVVAGEGIAVEEYDPIADKWTKKTDMPTARTGLATSVVNDKILAIGGAWFGACLSNVEEYDPITDTWTKKADLPTARYVLSSSAVGEKIYAMGGTTLNNLNALSTVEEYDVGFESKNVDSKGKLLKTWGKIKAK